MPKRKRAKAVFEDVPPLQMVDPTYAARALATMGEKAARLARKALKRKGCRDKKPATPP